MSQNIWSLSLASTSGGLLTISTTSATPLVTPALGTVPRVRSLQVTAASTTIQGILFCIYNGTSAAGSSTAIFSIPFQLGAALTNVLTVNMMDLRATLTSSNAGNPLTLAFATSLSAAGQLSINAQGDVVQMGYPPFQI